MSLLKRVNDLKNALGAIDNARELVGQVESLSEALTPFEGIDADEARTAIAEVGRMRDQIHELQGKAGQVDTLQGSLNGLTEENQAVKRSLLAARTLNTAGILPEFHDLLEPAIATAAELDQQSGAFFLPDDYLGNLRDKYPSAFAVEDAAGTGGAANEGSTPEQETTTYEIGNERVISGVEPDAVLNGSVQLK